MFIREPILSVHVNQAIIHILYMSTLISSCLFSFLGTVFDMCEVKEALRMQEERDRRAYQEAQLARECESDRAEHERECSPDLAGEVLRIQQRHPNLWDSARVVERRVADPPCSPSSHRPYYDSRDPFCDSPCDRPVNQDKPHRMSTGFEHLGSTRSQREHRPFTHPHSGPEKDHRQRWIRNRVRDGRWVPEVYHTRDCDQHRWNKRQQADSVCREQIFDVVNRGRGMCRERQPLRNRFTSYSDCEDPAPTYMSNSADNPDFGPSDDDCICRARLCF